MVKGLNINESTFCDLTTKEQNLVLFRNMTRIEDKFDELIEVMDKKNNSYIINRKIQYWWLSGLSIVFLAYLGIKERLGL